MSIANNTPLMIRLPLGDKDPARLEARIRNGILSPMDITCNIHGPNTSLDAVIVDRGTDHITVELQACCTSCAEKGKKLIESAAATA